MDSNWLVFSVGIVEITFLRFVVLMKPTSQTGKGKGKGKSSQVLIIGAIHAPPVIAKVQSDALCRRKCGHTAF